MQDALSQETDRLTILNRIGARLAAELDLEKLAQETTDAGVELIGAQFGAFVYNVLDEQGKRYTLYSLSGVSLEVFANISMPHNTEPFDIAFADRGILRSDDITRDPRCGTNVPYLGMPPGDLPIRSYLTVPVVSRSGNVLGRLLFGHERTEIFTHEHEQLLSGIAGQAAIAIDNAWLFRASQHEIAERRRAEQLARDRNARLELLAQTIERTHAADSPDALLDIVAWAARGLVDADGACVILREGNDCYCAAENAMQPLWKGQRFALSSCISGWAMQHRQNVAIADIRKDEHTPHELELYRLTFVRSLLVIPMLRNDKGIAAIGIYWATQHAAESAEIALIETLARSTAAIIERLEAERALRTLNETLEARVAERTAERDRMWRLTTDIMVVARLDTTITAVNPAWSNLLGWSETELIGHKYIDFIHPDDLEATLADAHQLSLGIPTVHFENRQRHRNGSYRWISWIAVPDEHFIHAAGRDITAQKEQAEALRLAEDALRHAQKMEALGQLTGGIAHDFNNLLGSIVGSLDLMLARLAQGKTEHLDRYAQLAKTSANRAAALTQRLLAFARRQPLSPKVVEVERLIASLEDLLSRTLGEAIHMEFAIAQDLWTIQCDPSQLESAILNLAINSRDAMPDGGHLVIAIDNVHIDRLYAAQNHNLSPGQYVRIAVSDTGTGMPHNVIERAFEPFFTTKPIGKGTGLGLSMIYGFAQQSGGHAQIHSEVGKGSTAELYLPRFQGVTTEDNQAVERADTVPPAS
ncbi:GAF domain-containing protein [Azomonas macrocytogenes]|uniref:histidine kinase n=1 Tax=Azomonas macrocytogenes TaxID=69962 RepID=A0A839T4Q3_AZOMA|nr:GAF domain-containing protein [Azomonas macrocytogenes]MBB3103304.1 PAS domain S-box-containing protein [Azomonas macrocytogenes]